MTPVRPIGSRGAAEDRASVVATSRSPMAGRTCFPKMLFRMPAVPVPQTPAFSPLNPSRHVSEGWIVPGRRRLGELELNQRGEFVFCCALRHRSHPDRSRGGAGGDFRRRSPRRKGNRVRARPLQGASRQTGRVGRRPLRGRCSPRPTKFGSVSPSGPPLGALWAEPRGAHRAARVARPPLCRGRYPRADPSLLLRFADRGVSPSSEVNPVAGASVRDLYS